MAAQVGVPLPLTLAGVLSLTQAGVRNLSKIFVLLQLEAVLIRTWKWWGRSRCSR